MNNSRDNILTPGQRQVIEAYRATGRVAFVYPRKKQISLNGGACVPVKEAIKHMSETLKRVQEASTNG